MATREYHFDDRMIKKGRLTLTGHGTVIKLWVIQAGTS
jgi:hypothetical protein